VKHFVYNLAFLNVVPCHVMSCHVPADIKLCINGCKSTAVTHLILSDAISSRNYTVVCGYLLQIALSSYSTSWQVSVTNKGKRKSCPCPRHECIWGSGGLTPLILNFGPHMEVSGQLHASAAFPRYLLHRRLSFPLHFLPTDTI
jgi:hypothetical protein